MEERQPTEQPRACPQCGTAYAAGQRRCTNCGSVVGARRMLPRRTPLVVALAVAAIAGGAVVVAQAEVTERAGAVASTTPDVAAAPIAIAGPALPEATRKTNTPPKIEAPEEDPGNSLEIPTLEDPALSDPIDPDTVPTPSPDGEPVDDDQPADPDDLGDEEKITVKRAFNFDPDARAGAEFGKPKAAIDKRSRTVWDVNIPADSQPFGVGLVLDLGETQRVSELKISTPTPGFGMDVFRADAEKRPKTLDPEIWTSAKSIVKVSDELVVPLADEPVWTRYILVLLTTPRAATDTRVAIGNLEVLP